MGVCNVNAHNCNANANANECFVTGADLPEAGNAPLLAHVAKMRGLVKDEQVFWKSLNAKLKPGAPDWCFACWSSRSVSAVKLRPAAEAYRQDPDYKVLQELFTDQSCEIPA